MLGRVYRARETSVGNFSKGVSHGDEVKDRGKVTFSTVNSNRPTVVPCEDYRTLQRLLRVTAYILKFIRIIRKQQKPDSQHSTQPSAVLCTEDI